MSVSSSTLRKLAELSLSPEQMAGVLGVIADMAEADEVRRGNQAERKRKQRAKTKNEGGGNHLECATVTGQSRDSHRDIDEKKENTPTPPKEKNIPPSPPKGGSSPTGFSDFWAIYPNKVGKRDAEKSFAKAKTRAPLDAIMAGLRSYVAKTDDRPWCNPATWLNQDRWEDAPASVQPRQGQPPPREDGFARALREDLERERMKRHEPPDHETTGYLDAGVTGTDQSGAHVVDIFAAPSLRR